MECRIKQYSPVNYWETRLMVAIRLFHPDKLASIL
jgi:hypothetical protein